MVVAKESPGSRGPCALSAVVDVTVGPLSFQLIGSTSAGESVEKPPRGLRLDDEPLLPGSLPETIIQRHHHLPAWSVGDPDQGGGQLKRIGSPQRMGTDQALSTFADDIRRRLNLRPPTRSMTHDAM